MQILPPASCTARGHDLVLLRLLVGGQLGGTGIHPALIVGTNATGDHQADTATGTLGKISRHALEPTGFFFEAGVHRTHQGTVAQAW